AHDFKEREMTGELVQVPDIAALQKRAADLFASAAAEAVAARGVFRVALAGGRTPEAVYALLVNDPQLRARISWRQVHFYFGDERHVGPEHPDSNFRMAREALFDRLPEEPGSVWRIKGEYSSAEDAAR